MNTHVPLPEDQDAIERLRLRGYAVVRQATYDNLRLRVERLTQAHAAAVESARSSEQWARDAHIEQRRLSDRLTEVVAAAASEGVSIVTINEVLRRP